MKWPRLRIGQLMVATTILAINCAFLSIPNRYPGRASSPELKTMAYASPPMATALIVFTFLIIRDLRRKGEARPFHAGFVLFGSIAWVLALLWLRDYDGVERYYILLAPSIEAFGRRTGLAALMNSSDFAAKIVPCLVNVILLGWPQWLVGSIGGLLAKGTGLTISRSRATGTAREGFAPAA